MTRDTQTMSQAGTYDSCNAASGQACRHQDIHGMALHKHCHDPIKRHAMTLEQFLTDWHSDSPTTEVRTSGSTGTPKTLTVEKERMIASAMATCQFLQLHKGDTALLCLSADHIAGKMMAVRSIVWGLSLQDIGATGHPMARIDKAPVFAAMVPMQVYNSLTVDDEQRKLMQIRHLIIGGGPVDERLEAQLRHFPNAVWSTYGMTETLSHIALRRLSGAEASEWYEPFDGVGVTTSADGCLVIDAPAVCAQPLVTNDIAEIAPDGRRFRIRGRRDNVVCSGGLKLQIEEMEARLQPHLNVPYMISKRPDDKFGEAVVLLAVTDDMESVCEVCRKHMPRYEQPRYFLAVSELPMTPTGKPARAEAMKLCAAMTSGK